MDSRFHGEKKPVKFPFQTAFTYIFLSTVLISGTAAFGYLFFLHVKEIQAQNDRFTVRSLKQLGRHRERIDSSYLAEALGLSSDQATNITMFSTADAEKSLKRLPMISTACVRKIKPSTIAVEYTLRTPQFELADLSNAVIDEEGIIMPKSPFFQDERLPRLYLGLREDGYDFGQQLNDRRLEFARHLLHLWENSLSSSICLLDLIDASHVAVQSFGQREAVLFLETQNKDGRLIVRLSLEDVQLQLQELDTLLGYFQKRSEPLTAKIIDLRAPAIALMRDL